jgi:ribonuclease R
MGDKVWIKVVAANLEKRQLDYEWVIGGKDESEENISFTKKKGKKRKK